MNLQLQKVLYKKIESCFEIKENIELQVQNQFSMNINYDEDNKHCFATLKNETVAVEHPEIFRIYLELVGIFSCDGIENETDKKVAHIQVYNYLFPYTQAMIADLSAKAGLPPLMIEMINLDPSSVNVEEIK